MTATRSWNIQQAADSLFSSGTIDSTRPSMVRVNENKIKEWFRKYQDTDCSNKMLVEGISTFCEDIGIDPEDAVILVISEYMGAAHMLEYTKEEFVKGMERIGVDNADSLKSKVDQLRGELKVPERFEEVYLFTFSFARPIGQKSMMLDVAIALWKILLLDKFDLLDMWVMFLEKHRTTAITKDEWSLVLEFVNKVNGDLSKYDEDGAWPIVIDDFIEYISKTKNKE